MPPINHKIKIFLTNFLDSHLNTNYILEKETHLKMEEQQYIEKLKGDLKQLKNRKDKLNDEKIEQIELKQ